MAPADARPDRLDLTERPSGARLSIHVIPRAPRDGLDGIRDGRLRLRLTSPPVDNAANEAAVRLLARSLDVARSTIRIVAGHTSRHKVVEIAGLSGAEVRARIDRAVR
jgi:uncharacterized protein (TIGR00251 family)